MSARALFVLVAFCGSAAAADLEVAVSDANKIATPEGWQPGDKVIVPPPQDVDAAEARMGEGHECVDWYFCKKSL